MKEATIEQLTNDVSGILSAAQRERVLVTSDGRPVAVVVGIANKDAEDLQLETSPEFWRMIEQRRRASLVKLTDVESQLLADE